jgi:hypothetical protein
VGIVYSTRFIASNTIGGTTNYTVPAGYRAVVRSITAVNNGSHETYAFVTIAGIGVALWLDDTIASQGFSYWNGRHVINTGEELSTSNGATDGGVAVMVSGYLLELP